MAKSIGNLELLAAIEKRMVALICTKNDCLCKGLPVDKINKDLKIVYGYWALFKDCSLTDEEINCVFNEMGSGISCKTAEPIYKYFYSRA
jgi:hypothetical protein